MLFLGLITWAFMTDVVEATDLESDDAKDLQQTESSISVQSYDQDNSEKIPFWELLTYKLFVFALFCSFFNLILYTLLEPILSNRLLEMGVKEENLGEYFSIQPFVYSGVSIFVDSLVLKHISKRL